MNFNNIKFASQFRKESDRHEFVPQVLVNHFENFSSPKHSSKAYNSEKEQINDRSCHTDTKDEAHSEDYNETLERGHHSLISKSSGALASFYTKSLDFSESRSEELRLLASLYCI